MEPRATIHPPQNWTYRCGAQTKRWLRFNAVGLMGFVLQALTLWALVHWSGLRASISVAIAVLVAVTHNFLWHERYTWRDRPRTERVRRWLSFNASNGVVSLISNIGVTMVLTTLTGLPILASNIIAVVFASLLNFLISDRLVFPAPSPREARRGLGEGRQRLG
jgi:dolichol-phosphate mannosyltransferase